MLKTRIMLIAAIALSTIFTNCNGSNNDRQGGNNQRQPDIPPLMNSYLEIKEALVEDDAPAARQASKEMMNNQEMSDGMKSRLEEIAGSEDLKQLRRSFSELSEQVYKMAKDGALETGSMYWNHCPMAINNEGANWLSMEEKISNPYMGQRMPACGSVQETLSN